MDCNNSRMPGGTWPEGSWEVDTLVLEDRESGRFHKINVDIGETVWYDHDILHAVTNVERGNRKVLVTWMKAHNDS